MPGRQSRRSVLATIAALPLTGALSACTGGSGTTRSRSTSKTTVTFWSSLRGSQEVVDAFHKAQDRIRVEYQQIPSGPNGGYAKLSNAARAGNAPDVATIEYAQLPGFAIDGVTRDITSLVSDRLRGELLPQALGLTTFDKKVFSIPVDVEPMVLHYRKDLFDKYGLDVPRTWDEYEDVARKVRDAVPDRRLGAFWTDGALQFAAYSWQAGAQWFDIRGDTWNVSMADAPTRRTAAYWQRLVDQDLLFMNPGATKEGDAQIANGDVLTRLNGAWDAGAQMGARPAQKGQWRIAGLPQWDTDHPAGVTQGGSTFAITKDSTQPEAAMEFIEWQVTSPEALRARLSSGTSSQYLAAPALNSVAREAFDRSYYGGQDIYKVFAAEAENIRPGWIWGPRMTPVINVMQDGFARASGGQGSLLDAVRGAQSGTMPDLRAMGLSTTQHGN
ncbi:ABC transporter substrate-binding protein [Streptomyces tsukubensis]|uniref:Sugar ABC transporter substrate-binding protein n=1 Tax=Streptomyces tsukubensis TaxID=83656 RepID=A0A1V4AFW6_9ACTN|nr:extracellular solute-binding protein [Streptomyces tsukubensis]OON82568.1 sugar ABC transporter substrate-binding protein [Streptomyces tsukubensis]QFR92268.1 extracellular solute-binding protein [Streptomyces tsukubensis]